MRAGVGYSEETVSMAAGRAAARQAMTMLGGGAPADTLLVFATAEHDMQSLEEGIRQVVGPTPIIVGGGSVGALTGAALGYGGSNLGICALRLDGVRVHHLCRSGVDGDPAAVGEGIGRDVAALGIGDPQVLMFYDAVRGFDGHPVLNMATPLLDGMRKGYGGMPAMGGAGMIGNVLCGPASQFVGRGIGRNTAQVLVFEGGGIRLDTTLIHGCTPASGYRTITRAEGPVVLELDGRPAVEVIDEILAGSGCGHDDYPFFLTLGVNHGDRWGEYDEDSYQNRLCLGVDEARGGLVMFEPDLQEGMQIQLMQRSVDMSYVRPRVEAVLARAERRRPVLAFYVNCTGRAAAYCGLDREDALEVQRSLGGRVPLLGMYSGVEIARVRDSVLPLNWTGVLCLLSVDP